MHECGFPDGAAAGPGAAQVVNQIPAIIPPKRPGRRNARMRLHHRRAAGTSDRTATHRDEYTPFLLHYNPRSTDMRINI